MVETLSDKFEYEKERMIGINTEAWSTIQRLEVDVRKAVKEFLEEINKLSKIRTGQSNMFLMMKAKEKFGEKLI